MTPEIHGPLCLLDHERRCLETHIDTLARPSDDPLGLLRRCLLDAWADLLATPEGEGTGARLAAWWSTLMAISPARALALAAEALHVEDPGLDDEAVRVALRRRSWGVETLDERDERHRAVREERAREMRARVKARLDEGDGRAERFVAVALDRACGDVAGLAQGERTPGLFRIAYSLGGLVGAGLLDRETARAALEASAGGLGVLDRDIRRTVARGLDRGALRPRNPLEGR
ncbi:MAG TPA: hypothetical protein VI911_04215 [Patescibacteria group bacterium]|nr:hypothetical protein [Patescibacteria group bacterium]